MKSLIKLVLGLLGVIVLLLALAAVILPRVYNSEDIKKAIASEVQKKTGRDLKIEGELDFSVFPWLAVEVGDLSLGNAKGFGDQPFAKIGEARVGVALLPLFQKQLVADEINLIGLQLNLAVNAQGKNNWDDLSNSETDTATESQESTSLFSSGQIAGLNIREARVEYQDKKTGAHYRVDQFSLQTGALGGGEAVDLTLGMNLEDVISATLMKLGLSTSAAMDFDSGRHFFDDLALEISSLNASGDTGAEVALRAPRLALDLTADTLSLDSFTFELGDLKGTGVLSARNIQSDAAFSGSLDVAEFSPAKLMAELGLEAPVTTDPRVLQSAKFITGFTGSSSAFAMTELKLLLDQSSFNGELSVSNFDRPAIRFDFGVDTMDVDRYLAPAKDSSASTEDVAIPQQELKGQDLQGNLQVDSLHLAGLDFSNARVGLNLKNGKLRINPLSAVFYDGTYSGNITLDGAGAVPVISLDEKLDGVTLKSLLAAVSQTESLSGSAIAYARMSGQGATSQAVLSSLNGELGASLGEGAYEGINIWYEIRKGLAKFKGQPAPPAEPDRTVFSRMQLDAGVKDGVVTTRELVGELPFLTLSGGGSVNLGSSSMDMKLVAAVRNLPELSQDPLTAELKGRRVPFRITGPLDDPSLSVDWAELLKGEATDMILKKIGLGTPSGDEDASGTAADDADGEASGSKNQLEDTAKGLLKGLLKPKKSDKNDDDG